VKKRVLVMSDTHCGHVVGLTPPEYQLRDGSKYNRIEQEMWGWFSREMVKYKPFDILIFNGDAIDGKGDRSGGTELLTADRKKQVEMARKVIEETMSKEVCMTYGTPYHTGKEEDWEAVLADKIGAKIESHGFYSINGCIFDVKHKIGSSTIPHGRFTAIAKDALWNELWSLRGQQERANIIIRSHVHYFAIAGDSYKTAFITPGLQGYGSKFGSRMCSGTEEMNKADLRIL
jgi:hypothetical protein